jgi:signal transduction histidine kinase
MIVFAAVVFSRFNQAEESRYRSAALHAAERVAGAVDREIAGLEVALQALSTGRSFSERAYDRFYDRALEGKRIIRADVILKDQNGQQLVNTRVPFGAPLPSSLQEHEIRALQKGKPETSDLFVGAFSQQFVISIAVPVGRDGEPAHLLVIAIDPERLGEVLKAQALPENWTVALVDRKGSIMARSKDHGRLVGQRAPAEMSPPPGEADAAWQGKNADGVPALLAHAKPHLAPEWRVVVGVPVKVAQAPLNSALIPLAAGGFLALLISGAAAAWMGRQAAGAMSDLAGAASGLSHGGQVAPVQTSVREINHVGAALVAAAANLQLRDRERQEAEEALRKLNESLEATVAERTAQLTQLQKLEALGQLTGGVAHDFNNLLMVVLGSLELVQKRVRNDARTKRLIENAIQGAQRGAILTQRLLAFARRQDLAPTAVDVAALVGGMSDLLRRTLGPQVDLDVRIPSGLSAARADANQLELALLNLAVNGRDAMPVGGRLTIEARSELSQGDMNLPSGDYIVLSVSDTGFGMDEDTLRRATEPFFTTKGVGKGTGLGVSMVHGLAEQSGGRLMLKSTLGLGTTAELWLPLVGKEDELPSVDLARGSAEGARANSRILVVDDDPLVLSGTADLLHDLGHSVVEANSARHGLEILEKAPGFDIVITDYAMPAMTGLELIDRLRRLHPTLPSILATGFAEAPELVDPPVMRLTKPFTQAALADAIAQTLGGTSNRG